MSRSMIFFAESLVFWSFGCSDNATDSTLTDGSSGLNDRFGGYTVTDEKPSFDDPDLLAQVDNDEDYEDPILTLADVDSMLADNESGFYHLRIVWGQLCLDTMVSVASDWSGSLTVNRGAEIIRRVIRFEPNTDYILPRTDRKLVEWVSKTTVHNDGIAVDIVIPRPVPVVDTTTETEITPENDTVVTIVVDTVFPVLEPVEVAFETGPYSSTFTLAEISALDTIIYLDDSSAVAQHGLKLDYRPCERNFLNPFIPLPLQQITGRGNRPGRGSERATAAYASA